MSEADVVANQLNAMNQKLDELKAIATTNSAKVDELKTTITASNERTYAQVAAAAVATPNPSARIMKRQQAEQAKRERAKFQFTLSTKFVSEDAKKELGLQHPKEITARCQHAIDQQTSRPSQKFKPSIHLKMVDFVYSSKRPKKRKNCTTSIGAKRMKA